MSSNLGQYFGNYGMNYGPTPSAPNFSAYNSGIPFSAQNGGFGAWPGQMPAQQPQGLNVPGMFQGISQGLGAFTSLAQVYGMIQNLGLQKKAFKVSEEGTKRNFNASATAYNDAVASKETARNAYANANGQDYNSFYKYGTGKTIDKWS